MLFSCVYSDGSTFCARACCTKIKDMSRFLRFVPEELVHLERDMAYLYYCNFSVFQSAPDTWAIDQLFPIMPIHRLDGMHTHTYTHAKVTCYFSVACFFLYLVLCH